MLNAAPWHSLTCAALCILGLALPAHAAQTIEYGTIGGPTAAAWPLLIGLNKGLFAAEGLVVDFVYAPSSAAVQQQLAAGSVPMGDGGLNDPIRAIFEGAPIALVRLQGVVPPYTVLAKPPLKTLKELRGKTIMVGGPKDITLTYLVRMMAPNGLNPGDYDLAYAGSTIARLSALQAGAVDAAMLLPPFSFHAEAAGFNNLGLVEDYAKLAFTAMVVNRDWAAQNTKPIEAFLDVYTKSVAWFDDTANRAEAVRILIDATHQTQEDTEKSYDYYRKIAFFEPTNEVSRQKIQAVVDTIKGDFGGKPFSVDQMFLPGVTHVTP
jgi:NitT/TauT family transport system substrate-binding protein